MPLYDWKCRKCSSIFESIKSSDVTVIQCPLCPPQYLIQSGITSQSYEILAMADRQLSAPARIHMADMPALNTKRHRIKEPMWLDQATGKRTPVHP